MDKARGVLMLVLLTAASAQAVTPSELLSGYAAQAGMTVAQIDPAAGERLFRQGGSGEKQCTSCHTQDPRAAGKTRAGKRIEPMAPAVNPARFTDAAKVEKWFGRNCKDVLGRECTPVEKAGVLAWLMRIGQEEK